MTVPIVGHVPLKMGPWQKVAARVSQLGDVTEQPAADVAASSVKVTTSPWVLVIG